MLNNKVEERENNKESELLNSYLEELIYKDTFLKTSNKIYLFDSLFSLNKYLNDWAIENTLYYPDKSIQRAISNLSKNNSKSVPINFLQLTSVRLCPIYQSNLYNDSKTGEFDKKFLHTKHLAFANN